MKKFSFSKTLLTILLAITVIAAIAVPAISIYKYNLNADQFVDDGYMLLASSEKDSESINTQYYFNVGEKYRKTYDNNVTFSDINGNKVTAESENFVHYNSGSMNGLAESVILDTDNVDADGQTSYYSIPEHTMLEKSGKRYVVNNAGNNINFSNFLWKISTDRYMVVSPTIKLVVSDKTEQSFEEFVELRYIDEGIAHIVTHEGTYSTVSSDAYLELENGIRIYIGSKNISDKEGILMNMSQMVVGSDDNVEVIPDDDYTIENDKQPQIVVNATDGETGANGEEGDAGENGENGEPGAKGNKGGTGIGGNDAPNANILFEPEVKPLFTNLDVKTNTYGFDATVSYNENSCIVEDAYVSVIDKNSGKEVWRQNIKNNPGLNSSISFNSETLSSDTEYVMNITGVYRTADSTVYLQEVLNQQSFKTESLGLVLSKKYATDRSLNFDLKKVSESNVDYVRIRVFDKNMEFLGETGYAIPVDLSEHNIDQNKAFSVYNLGLDEAVETTIENLNSNSIYYAQIQIMSVSEGSAVPTSTYEKQKFRTLKVQPTIGKPSGRVEETISSFMINPGDVVDLDSGITGYRYEIYEAADLEKGPVYSVDLNQLQTISVPIGQENDENVLHREVIYYAQIVALFDNNEEIIEVRSEFSDSLYAGTNTAPEFSLLINTTDGYITPTTFEGRVVINDKFSSIDPNAKVTVVMKTSLDPAICEEGTSAREVTLLNNVAFADFVKNGDGFDYSYPVSAKSLKADSQEYTLYCYVSQIKNGDNIVGSEDNPVLIGSDSFVTQSYSPIYVGSSTIEDTKYLKNWFAINLKFAPSNPSHEEGLRDLETIVAGLADKENGLADMTGRSMTYLYLELYNGKLDPETNKYVPGTTSIANALITDEIKSDQQTLSNYGYTYTFNSDLYTKAYCKNNFADTKTITDEDFGLVITDDVFTVDDYNPIWEANDDDVFFIKVSAYDYTYGTTFNKEYHVNGKSNVIPIGTATGFTSVEDYTDQWISVTAHYAIPAIPDNYPYIKEDAKLTLGTEKTLYKEPINATYYDFTVTGEEGSKVYTAKHYSNLVGNPSFTSNATKEELETLWEELGISDQTVVGVEYRGPSLLAMYCSQAFDSVQYKVYKGNIENFYDGDSTNDPVLVTTTGWLNYDYTKTAPNNVMIDYTYFFDVEDPTSHITLHRGDEFFIETELKIKGKEQDSGIDCIYPKYFYENDILPEAPKYKAENVVGKMVEAGTKVTSELIHTFRIFDDCTTNKQWPVVLTMPYDGTVNNTTNSDITLLYINDPDKALDRDGTNKEAIIYIPDLDDAGQIQYVESAEGPEVPKIIKLKEFDVTEIDSTARYPLKVAVNPGDKIDANCFKDKVNNNSGENNVDGTLLSLLDAEGNWLNTISAANVYAEYNANGYYTVPAEPAGVKYVLFSYWTEDSSNYCYLTSGTNYYNTVNKVSYYFDEAKVKVTEDLTVYPIKVAVNVGDKIVANCFKDKANNNSGNTVDGTLVSLLDAEGNCLQTISAANLYAEYSTRGYFTVPNVEGVTSVLISYYTESADNYCYITSATNYWDDTNRVVYHFDETGKMIFDSTILYKVSGSMQQIDNLYAKYKLKETQKEFTTIKLNSEEGIVGSRALYFHDTLSDDPNFYGVAIPMGSKFKFAFQNKKTVQIEFLYTCTNDADGDKADDLLGADITFTKYVYAGVTQPIILKSESQIRTAYMQEDISSFLHGYSEYDEDDYPNIAIVDISAGGAITNPREYYTYDSANSKWVKASTTTRLAPAEGENSQKTILVKPTLGDYIVDNNVYYHKGYISIDGITIADIIKGSEKININIRAYYDSGEYGLKYADIANFNSANEHDSEYYLFEVQNEDGIADHINPTTSAAYEYPDSYYATNVLDGLDMANANADKINTYLFERDTITYQLDKSRIVLGETQSHDDPPIDIPDELLNIVKVTENGFNNGVFKHAKKDSTSMFVEMSYILPTYEEIKIKAGHTTALFNFKIYDSETVLTHNQPVVIRCIKAGADKSVEGNWTTVSVPYSPTGTGKATQDGKDRIWTDILVENLKSNNGADVKFNYEVFAYVNDGTTEGSYTKIYDKGEFTIARYDHYPNEDIIFYESYTDSSAARVTRDSKRIVYGLNMKDVIKSDINKNLSQVVISAYKYNDVTTDESGNYVLKPGAHAVSSTSIAESALEDKLGDKESGDIYYEAQLPWQPETNTDHIMNPEQRYFFKVDYKYKDGDFDIPAYKQADYNTELVKWRTSLSSAYFTISGTKKASFDGVNIIHQIIFNVSGRDTNRLFASTNSNTIKYIADLYKEGTDVPVQTTGIVEANIDANGRIATKSLSFTGLEHSTRYYIKLYYVADFENIDINDITSFETTYRTDAFAPTVNNRSGVYCKTSSMVVTESSDMMILNTVKLDPTNKNAEIIGSNLNLVGKVQYIVKDALTGVETTYPALSGSDLTANFTPDQDSNNVYYLKLPQINDPSANYIVYVYIYRSSTDENYQDFFEARWPRVGE